MSDTENDSTMPPSCSHIASRDLVYILGLFGERVESVEVVRRVNDAEHKIEVKLAPAAPGGASAGSAPR